MSDFEPTRASPPARPLNRLAQATLSDISRSSSTTAHGLLDLTSDDVSFLDAVIRLAGPKATTFPAIFKAYFDLLSERGIDTVNEVVYYRKILKLGNVRAATWAEKWNMVKQQQGLNANNPRAASRTSNSSIHPPHPSRMPSRESPRRVPLHAREDDIFTLHSHEDESQWSDHDNVPVPRKAAPAPRSEKTHSFDASAGRKTGHGLDNKSDVPPRKQSPRPLSSRAPRIETQVLPPWGPDPSEETETNLGSPSTTPPSYRTVVRETARPKQRVSHNVMPIRSRTTHQTSDPPNPPSTTARRAVKEESERRSGIKNEEDAWQNIRMARDERDADRFRTERLVERCWDVWKQGYEWIQNTHAQIAHARDVLTVRSALYRWRQRLASKQNLLQRVGVVGDSQRLRRYFTAWRTALKTKRQAAWREDMRARMKSIRDSREGKLRKDAWAKWRQSYRSHLSGQRYEESLVLRFYRKWRASFYRLDQLEDVADAFIAAQESKLTIDTWSHWRRRLDVLDAERVVSRKVGLRLAATAMETWRRQTHDHAVARSFRDRALVRAVLRSWKGARDRIRMLEAKAAKYLARQDDVLLCAIVRVWRARERGRVLEKVMDQRLYKEALVHWMAGLHRHIQLQDKAISFAMRGKSYVVISAFRKWRHNLETHQNALAFAIHYHSAQLRYKTMLTWRLQLRLVLRMNKKARAVEKVFVARKAWGTWKDQLIQKLRAKAYRKYELRKAAKVFREWLQRAQTRRHVRHSERQIQRRIHQHTLKDALSAWTNRVIEVKVRELETTQRYEVSLLTSFFKKWRSVCVRHVEEVSLMESYQFVKREEQMRRMFHAWLTAARAARHRRLALQQMEDERRQNIMTIAWDRWRDRFCDERLRPIEYAVILQSQKNLLFRAFGVWQANTMSVPAIRFHASHVKAKFWAQWRALMPKAIQASQARKKHAHSVLSKAFEKWLQVYRTKRTLKAVARARYLRLPTSSTPRSQVAPTRRVPPPRPGASSFYSDATPEPAQESARRSRFSVGSSLYSGERNLVRPRSDVPQTHAPGSVHIGRITNRPRSSVGDDLERVDPSGAGADGPSRGRGAFPYPRGAGRRSPSRASEAISAPDVGVAARSNLWKELRDVRARRRSRPRSDRSGSPEPP